MPALMLIASVGIAQHTIAKATAPVPSFTPSQIVTICYNTRAKLPQYIADVVAQKRMEEMYHFGMQSNASAQHALDTQLSILRTYCNG